MSSPFLVQLNLHQFTVRPANFIALRKEMEKL
jgi:hypothetical protein